MKEKYILALDQGTTSSRAIIFDRQGNIVGKAAQEFPQIYPNVGWVEHNPIDIISSQVGVISEALIRAGVTALDILAMGITNQRETTIVWDRVTGKPIYNAIVWQCRRTSEFCDKLKKDGFENFIYNKTGLMVDAYFSATKLKWILDNVDGARTRANNGELCFGTVDTYLMWHLSNGAIFATDYTNASRTMLFNIHTLEWDNELLKLFDIPVSLMPEVKPSSYEYGYTVGTILGHKIPITGVAGDQQAALFGQLCLEKGSSKNTYGTGCFMLMNTDEAIDSSRGLITTLTANIKADNLKYALEGSVFVGGAVVQWLRDEMRMIKNASETEMYASRVKDANGVYIVPAFVGLGAPHWDAYARGTITGITRGTKKEHFIRAALESIAYQVFDILHAMERDSKISVNSLNVDGGASANNFLMQFQADILGVEVVRPKVVETTALGVCYLAGLEVGYYKSVLELKSINVGSTVFKPNMKEDIRQKLLLGWEESVGRARYKI